MWANAWAMLEPISMKELLTKWLAMDQHGCYALDCVSGKGAGPWYAANDWSIFRCVDAYLGVTGDKAFLSQVIHGKTVLQRLEDTATFYEQRPLTKDSLLADYGGPGNLLECSERYVQGVASLTAANVRIANRGGQDFNEGCGAAFAEVIIRSFFGYRPDLSGDDLQLLAPRTPRGFNGQLRHVPFRGAVYTIMSDAQGIHQKKE